MKFIANKTLKMLELNFKFCTYKVGESKNPGAKFKLILFWYLGAGTGTETGCGAGLGEDGCGARTWGTGAKGCFSF